VDRFISEYKRALRIHGSSYPADEIAVGKLFVSGLAGQPAARTLFCHMPEQVHLDGAPAEGYAAALRELMEPDTTGRPDARRCMAAFAALRK
jgi:hypothetical protein